MQAGLSFKGWCKIGVLCVRCYAYAFVRLTLSEFEMDWRCFIRGLKRDFHHHSGSRLLL